MSSMAIVDTPASIFNQMDLSINNIKFSQCSINAG